MTTSRTSRFALAFALTTSAFVTVASNASAHSSWSLVSARLPATLVECSPSQARHGGATYTNLWTIQVTSVDLTGEKVFTNARETPVANPRMVLHAPAVSTVLAAAFSGQRSVIEDALASSLHLARVSPLPTALIVAAGRRHVAPHQSLVVYATSKVDVSQGFLSRVSRGCNSRGAQRPWVLSAIAAGALTYHVAVVPTASLVARTYQPPASVPLAFLAHVVTHLDPSSTGPLPAGLGFPKLQTELVRNDTVVAYAAGGRGSVFLGWLKDRLPLTNRLSPFRVTVVRAGSW